ncbi:unnamed protein product [marine sediment metagenome]|uniref:DUF308 domain-containing protein n=1 Tax=marine sediment metagenome TaxID=412755 RepID=X0ULA6_9ZZZZ
MDDEKQDEHSRGRSIGFWIALLRGVFAIMLGLILIFNPEKTKVMLANFMGFFWLTSGIILIRHTSPVFGVQTDRVLGKRTALVMGLAGILFGLLVVSRSITRRWVDEVVFFELLGAVILLTGVLHLFGEFSIGRVIKRKRTTAQKILAVFEILLGVLLIVSPLEQGPFIYLIATIWALIGGGLIITDAFYQRAQVNREQDPQGKPAEIGEE